MSKPPAKTRSTAARKTLSPTNLTALGADRLADLLIAVAGTDTNWRRRLRLELAAEVGAPDLAMEIDKRLAALAASRARVSWRKRADLIEDLSIQRQMIVDRLAPLDARMALDRMIAWFDLYPGLETRVKDPKGELSALFFNASEELAAVASAAGPEAAVPRLFEALQTRSSEWAAWVGRAAPALDRPLAIDLLRSLTAGRPRPTGRLALVVRKLAERSDDVQAWIESVPDPDKARPDVGAEIARRLADAGRVVEARAALDVSKPRPPSPSGWAGRSRSAPIAEPSEPWEAAEIVVLDAEDRNDDAQAARWTLFERTLSEAHLRGFLSRLPDFEDVEALDRAFSHAAAWPDATRGLAFLMAWPALREAAGLVMARSDVLRGGFEDVPLWAARLEARYPAAALLLVRARAKALIALGPAAVEEVRELAAEAAVLAETPGAADGLASHAAFIDELEAAAARTSRPRWR